jgi:hypothetical protein
LDWVARQQEILRLAGCQLFFVGGAPRSGTTWLQLLLDSHPEVCCRGEGLFRKHLADPLDSLVARRREALAAKNAVLFANDDGYPLPDADDADALLGTAVLLALHAGGADCTADPDAERLSQPAAGDKTEDADGHASHTNRLDRGRT